MWQKLNSLVNENFSSLFLLLMLFLLLFTLFILLFCYYYHYNQYHHHYHYCYYFNELPGAGKECVPEDRRERGRKTI